MNTTIKIGLGGYTILQAPNMTEVQMMSYVITTPQGNVIVIDGGLEGDAPYLKEEILLRGGHVSLWLLTHCHDDHYGALLAIDADPCGITIEKVCYNFPPQEWVDAVEPDQKTKNDRIYNFLATHPSICQIVRERDILDCDGLKVEVMNDPMDFNKFTTPSPNNGSSVNDTSLVYRFTFPNGKTALFLGDLGLRAGNLFADRYGESLKSDIVQMAHHGQNGAGENVYQLIRPEVCMWTAPMWLWNNDLGDGFNTYRFKTVTVRSWMEKLGVKHHAIEGEGPAIII